MSFKGTQSRMTEETCQNGIDGITAISDIPAGYVIEAENVDLSQPGVIRKRSGYNLHGCKLPIRCRSYSSGRHLFDFIQSAQTTLDVYSNTTLNATATQDSTIKRVASTTFTYFVEMTACGITVTLDTVFEIRGDIAPFVQRIYFQPIAIFNDGSDGTNPKFLVPKYIGQYFDPMLPAPTDAVPYGVVCQVGVGYTHPKIVESDILGLELRALYGFGSSQELTIRFEKGSVPEDIGVGSAIYLETVAMANTGAGNRGVVTAVTDETLVCRILNSLGANTTAYFQMRYFTGKSVWVKSKDYDYFHSTSSTTSGITLTGVSEVTMAPVGAIGTNPGAADILDYFFIYGLDISAGYVQVLNKYLEVESGKERLVCGVYGSLFVEQANPKTSLSTIGSLIYTDPSTLLAAVSGTFAIPLPNANQIYLVGDEVSLSYASNTAGTIVTEAFTVTAVDANFLTVDARNLPYLNLVQYTSVKLKRTSSSIQLPGPITEYVKLFAGATLQVGVGDRQKPVYVIKKLSTENAAFFLELDSEVEWESDSFITPLTLFYPVFQTTPAETFLNFDETEPLGTFKDIQTTGIERSVVLAAEKSGMWRFNGRQLLSLRIPTPTLGFIRNVSGSGGTLKIDETDDGQKVGRFYRFYVSYSYSELVNGKLVRYESGLNPIGSYRITSKPAIDGSYSSQLVELQVATIPNGIGLPAEDMVINVYRSPSGTANDVESDTEVLLKEVEVPNTPSARFVRVLAGIAPRLQFNEENYDFLYLSQGGDRATDEASRNIVDAPFAKVLTTQENRVVAANGWDWPYVNLICKRVFDPSTGSFAAHGRFTLVPPSSSETAYRFLTCPCDLTTASGTAGGPGGPVFQSFSIPTYAIKKITYSDNSHLFKVGATVPVSFTAGKRYLLRFIDGIREAKAPGGKDPYFDGFGFEEQVFVATSVASQLSAQKKWVTTNASGALRIPLGTEQVTVFEEIQSITAVATDNGINIEGNTGIGVKGGSVRVTLFVKDTTAPVYVNGDWLILKGLGTTGQIRDAAGNIKNWDTDIIAKVTVVSTASNPDEYLLSLYVKGDPTNDFVPLNMPSAISVSNEATGVSHGPFTIFKQTATTARTLSDFSLSPTTATIQITTSPAIAPAAGTRICVDGLPEFIPANCEMNFNTNFEITNFAVDTFTVKVTPPPNMRGTGGQDFTGDPNPGKLGVLSLSFAVGTGPLPTWVDIPITPVASTVTIASVPYAYLIVRGKDQDSYCMELSGWFQIMRAKVGGVWKYFVNPGEIITDLTIDLRSTSMDVSSITGISEARIIVCNSDPVIPGLLTINVPIPVPTKQRYDADVTGTFYGPYDGYTPLEKVSKRYAHAISAVLHSSYWGYWGKFRPDLEREQDIPTNGCRIQPHKWPENAYRYRNSFIVSATGTNESAWRCEGEPGYWKVEGEDTFEPSWTPVTTYTAKKYRPSRIWWTNKAGSAEGVSFRELSLEEIDSDDGDEIVGMVPFQTYSIAAKRSSVWRLSFGGGTVLSTPKVPSTIGSASAKNMVATERGVFFLHESGLYITDGALVEPVLQTSRYYNSKVVQNKDLFRFTAGHHNPLGKTVYLGVPLSAEENELATDVSGQFVFNYSLRNVTLNTIDYGWSVNTQFPATYWVRVKTDDFFSTDTGKVYKLRTELGRTRFSDDRSGIPLKLSTRYIDSQDPIDFKFYRSLFFQFGKETSANMKVSLAWDFAKDYTLISTIPIMQEGFGTAPFGTSYWGCDRYIETIRRTPVQPRVAQLSIRLENDEVDTASEVYGIFLESTQITSKLHKQPGV